MSCALVRFGLALFLGSIVALTTILMMKTFIDEYDDVASDTIVRVFKLQTVSLADSDYQALPYNSEYADEGDNKVNSTEGSDIATTDKKSKASQEILRKRQEIISILEAE